MNTIHKAMTSTSKGRVWLALLVLAGGFGIKPAQAGTEEALAGIVLGAILISAAQDSHAEPAHYHDRHTQYREVHYRTSHDNSHRSYSNHGRQIAATHRPTQRGHAHRYEERYAHSNHTKCRQYDKHKHHRDHSHSGKRERKQRQDRYSYNGHQRY